MPIDFINQPETPSVVEKAKPRFKPIKENSDNFGVIEREDGTDFVPNEDDLALDLIINMDFEATCPKCAHYGGGSTCKAFPKGIPDVILKGAQAHTKPYPGDNGTIFTPKT